MRRFGCYCLWQLLQSTRVSRGRLPAGRHGCGGVIYARRSFGFRTTMASWLVLSWATLWLSLSGRPVSAVHCCLEYWSLNSSVMPRSSPTQNVYQKFGRRLKVIVYLDILFITSYVYRSGAKSAKFIPKSATFGLNIRIQSTVPFWVFV